MSPEPGHLPDDIAARLRAAGAEVGCGRSGHVLRVDFRVAPQGSPEELLRLLDHCPRLRELYLRGPQVTDAQVLRCAGWQRLQVFDLEGCRITDEGLAAVTALPSLKILNVRGTAVTAGAVAALRKQRVGVRIIGP